MSNVFYTARLFLGLGLLLFILTSLIGNTLGCIGGFMFVAGVGLLGVSRGAG